MKSLRLIQTVDPNIYITFIVYMTTVSFLRLYGIEYRDH